MFKFFQNPGINNAVKEIETLVMRLNTSTYKDDVKEALEEIEIMILERPDLATIDCIKAIINSLNSVSTHFHRSILMRIISSERGGELNDLLLQEDTYFNTLAGSVDENEMYEVLYRLINCYGSVLLDRLSDNQGFHKKAISIPMDNKKGFEFLKILASNPDLKRGIVSAGLFYKILSNKNISQAHLAVLDLFLADCKENRAILYELEWEKIINSSVNRGLTESILSNLLEKAGRGKQICIFKCIINADPTFFRDPISDPRFTFRLIRDNFILTKHFVQSLEYDTKYLSEKYHETGDFFYIKLNHNLFLFKEIDFYLVNASQFRLLFLAHLLYYQNQLLICFTIRKDDNTIINQNEFLNQQDTKTLEPNNLLGYLIIDLLFINLEVNPIRLKEIVSSSKNVLCRGIASLLFLRSILENNQQYDGINGLYELIRKLRFDLLNSDEILIEEIKEKITFLITEALVQRNEHSISLDSLRKEFSDCEEIVLDAEKNVLNLTLSNAQARLNLPDLKNKARIKMASFISKFTKNFTEDQSDNLNL